MAMTMKPMNLLEHDHRALQACVDHVLGDTSDPASIEQVTHFLERDGWFRTADFCCYHVQRRALGLKPWEVPPGSGPNTPEGQRLLDQMLKAGVSRYDPDPLGALRAARSRKARHRRPAEQAQ